MRKLILAVCIVLGCVAVLAFSLWQRCQDSEVSAVEYGALYSLRRMDPDLFKEKLLPELEKAMADGRLTHGELRAVAALSKDRSDSLGPAFMKAITTPSLDEMLGENLREMEKKAGETGRSLGDALGKALDRAGKTGQDLGDTLGKALDEAMDAVTRKSEELFKERPSAPRAEPPSTF